MSARVLAHSTSSRLESATAVLDLRRDVEKAVKLELSFRNHETMMQGVSDRDEQLAVRTIRRAKLTLTRKRKRKVLASVARL